MDRRAFASMLPALFAGVELASSKVAGESLPALASGVFSPAPAKGAGPRVSRGCVTGLLKAGNVRLEIHETTQQAGAPHEAIGTHLHNELWLVREGTVELTTNGVARTLVVGDVGLCVAGDEHFIRNAGETAASYFVVAIGPIE